MCKDVSQSYQWAFTLKSQSRRPFQQCLNHKGQSHGTKWPFIFKSLPFLMNHIKISAPQETIIFLNSFHDPFNTYVWCASIQSTHFFHSSKTRLFSFCGARPPAFKNTQVLQSTSSDQSDMCPLHVCTPPQTNDSQWFSFKHSTLTVLTHGADGGVSNHLSGPVYCWRRDKRSWMQADGLTGQSSSLSLWKKNVLSYSC